MRNAILPVVTYIGPMFAALITGSFVVEKVSAYRESEPVHQQHFKPRLHPDHGYHRVLRDPGDLYSGCGYPHVLIDPRIKYQ